MATHHTIASPSQKYIISVVQGWTFWGKPAFKRDLLNQIVINMIHHAVVSSAKQSERKKFHFALLIVHRGQ